ncbi:MAG: hypothetical protein QCI38_00860, partial [Candidatus Thermoplasmatota archaeon]|nr:hypothetical protein [Candidatus Thermoplasmatota archaeon]
PTLFVPNAVPKSQITQQRMEKLSAKTGKLHLVHVGGIDIPPIASAKYRAIFPLLEKISKMGFHVHLYATATPEKSKTMKTICDKSNTLHWHDPVPPPQLYKELTQYDAGLIMVRDDPKHNQHMGISLPNRLFEYLSAGLFVVSSSRLKAVNAFTNPQGWGAEIRSVDEVASLSADIKPIPWDDRFCLEYYLKDLRKAYDTLV